MIGFASKAKKIKRDGHCDRKLAMVTEGEVIVDSWWGIHKSVKYISCAYQL